MALTHEINPDLQRLVSHYHSGELNTNEYRAKRRAVLDALVKTKPAAPPRSQQTRTVKNAKYIGLMLLVISLVALILFGFKFKI